MDWGISIPLVVSHERAGAAEFPTYRVFLMIKLRLKRYGKKREASYRIVAMNSSTRRDGRPLEELGFYNPRNNETRLDVPAIVKRLQQGAQPTDTVRDILRKANVFEQVGAGANLESSNSATVA